MPGPTTVAGFDLLALSKAASSYDLAGGSRKTAGASPDSVRRSLATEQPHAKVLIVEDEALLALDICDFLNEAGYEVVGLVATEQDATRMASELRPDLVIMDLKLKDGGDGFRASEAIHGEQDIPILYITAYRNQETLERLDEQATSEILFKPFARDPLLEAVRAALKNPPNRNGG